MKVSIITVTFNSERNIEECINSVRSQTYNNIEHVIIDGASTDNTVSIIKNNYEKISKLISEPDNGIYGAINKGIKYSTGDVIGLLHSGDTFYYDDVISDVVNQLNDEKYVGLYGDLIYFNRKNNKISRFWKSNGFHKVSLHLGWMPPHPTLFLRNYIFEQVDEYDEKLKISADYKFVWQVFDTYGLQLMYLDKILIKMETGGVSNRNLKSLFIKYREDYQILKMKTKFPIITLIFKNVIKFKQFFNKVKNAR